MKVDFDREFLKELRRSSEHFWFSGRNEKVLRAIKRFYPGLKLRALELGAGSGSVLFHLSRRGIDIDGSDIYTESISHISKYAKNVFLYDVRKPPEGEGLGKLKGVYDVVILADVIEHLTDPLSALQNAQYFCKEKGIIIVTAPALKQLWSGFDVVAGHKRRYTKELLKDEMAAAGLKCLKVNYFFFAAAIVLFFRRNIARKPSLSDGDIVREEFRINAFANYFFKGVCALESMAAFFFNPPFGSSLIAVGRKV